MNCGHLRPDIFHILVLLYGSDYSWSLLDKLSDSTRSQAKSSPSRSYTVGGTTRLYGKPQREQPLRLELPALLVAKISLKARVWEVLLHFSESVG